MKFLLDTCVISDFFKKNPCVISGFERSSPIDIAISSITVMEIEYGLKINQERALKIQPLWQSLMHQIQIISFTNNDAIFAAEVRAHLKKQGLLIGPYDMLLAGIALQRDLIFVTSNTKEFIRIPHLHLEDWRQNAFIKN